MGATLPDEHFYYLYLTFYIEKCADEVFTYIASINSDVRNNHLYAYLYAIFAFNDHRVPLAGQIIRQP